MTFARFKEFLKEKHDMNAAITVQDSGDMYIEIQFESVLGEDFHTGFSTPTEEDMVLAFDFLANDFDPYEHAEKWIEQNGEDEGSNSKRDRIDDAVWIKESLLEAGRDAVLTDLIELIMKANERERTKQERKARRR